VNLTHILTQLQSDAELVSAAGTDALVPDCPGLYAISIDDPLSLPSPYSTYAKRSATPVIYVGKASSSTLQTRLVKQDLRHKNASTFFRGIGAILGYVPPRGSLKGKKNQRNYKFSSLDTDRIIDWINAHLWVRWVVVSRPEVELYEGPAIASLMPLLNSTHNPNRLSELGDLRRKCERIALS